MAFGLARLNRVGLISRSFVATTMVATILLTGPVSEADSPEALPAGASERVAQTLSLRHVDESAKWPGGLSRSLRDTFREVVIGVPFVITSEAFGSSAVVHVDPQTRTGLLVTNNHVASSAFVADDRRTRFVILVFYEPALASTVFDQSRVARCLSNGDPSPWCSMLRSVTRVGAVVATDPGRDLALLLVRGLPQLVAPIAPGTLDSVSPGDGVIVIGHPVGLLWSLTTGIVSGVRSNFRISPSGPTTMVLQTQAPVNPGNSGGPLLASDGRLLGIVFGSRTVSASQSTHDDVKVAAPGLNFAIGVNEVQDFLSRNASLFR